MIASLLLCLILTAAYLDRLDGILNLIDTTLRREGIDPTIVGLFTLTREWMVSGELREGALTCPSTLLLICFPSKNITKF